ncbi:RNA-binding domain-containing protein [Tilletiaria anomala UBC 951]|uniref:RNA-binding domain-containing protein n=1 Tax=Tilletiaria anomala (strain ATCC 24038 / CBS 436.72 / UBC 951) TaxID=1037660 RepID=A0A066W757_TILAU|nr:RNA-binding domain-containing protein [Tilletiaria anomala UBC 951]KDN49586.1 RNA-binding domain-containing protein [Tilletiaria anomala UBC 951]
MEAEPTAAAAAPQAEEAKGDAADSISEHASESVYINNLNEDIKIDVLKQTLKNLFGVYGPVLSVQAQKNVRMRGQAFVAFASKEQAAKAVKEVAGFPLYGKPIQISFARHRSTSVVEKLNAGNADVVREHKRWLKAHQARQRRGNQLRRNDLAAKIAEKKAAAGELDEQSAAALPGAHKRQEIAMPDEYLPPNKLLFVQNLPEGTTREAVEALFSSLDNFADIRPVPGNTKIAFVEFADIPSSTSAREKLNGYAFPSGEKIKITFAR